MKQIVDTWEINNRINLYLITEIDEGNYKNVSASKGRTVGDQFAHIHDVRLMWLKEAAPEYLKGIDKIEKGIATKTEIINSFKKSGEAISKLMLKGVEEGRIKGFKPHPTGFLGYIISHESHHRGQIILSLKQSGCPVNRKILFGLWEWGTK